MWIFCGGMQRSGSTLQYQIAAAIVEDYGLGMRVAWQNAERRESIIAELNLTPGYKVLKSHLLSPAIQCEFANNNAIGLYCFRDVRDVVSSLQAKLGSRYQPDQLPGLLDHLLEQHRLWVNQKGVYVSRYEDIVADLEGEIRNIGRFIGASLNEAAIREYGERFSLSSQLAYIRSVPVEQLVHVDDKIAFDRKSLLHRNHITDGSNGRYLKDLTLAQIEAIERIAGDWLVEYGYLRRSS